MGIALVCTVGSLQGGFPSLLLCMVSPVWSAFFLIFTSLMLLEKRLDKRFGGNVDYIAYKRRTSVLIPWFPQEVAEPGENERLLFEALKNGEEDEDYEQEDAEWEGQSAALTRDAARRIYGEHEPLDESNRSPPTSN